MQGQVDPAEFQDCINSCADQEACLACYETSFSIPNPSEEDALTNQSCIQQCLDDGGDSDVITACYQSCGDSFAGTTSGGSSVAEGTDDREESHDNSVDGEVIDEEDGDDEIDGVDTDGDGHTDANFPSDDDDGDSGDANGVEPEEAGAAEAAILKLSWVSIIFLSVVVL